MAYRHGRRLRNWRPLYSALLGVSLVVITVIALAVHDHSPLPKSINDQVSFVVLFPGNNWEVKPTTITYDKSARVLTLIAKRQAVTLSVNEQSTPSQFNDIPQYYPTLLTKLNQYDSFGSANGLVNLIRPAELNSVPQAVLNSNGTLLFVKPSMPLTNSDWRNFFNNLKIIK